MATATATRPAPALDPIREALAELVRLPHDVDHQRMWGRRLRLATGRIIAPGPDIPAEAICHCKGFLVWANGECVHLDMCKWCEDGVRCGDADATHPGGCDSPGPAPCQHSTCVAGNDLMAGPCVWGHLLCCGNHDGEC